MPRFEERYAATWMRFARLNHTTDSLAQERRGYRRWLLLPYLAFIIPITDVGAVAQLTAWQAALRPWLVYDPLNADQLHITLHMVGSLRYGLGMLMPHTWRRAALKGLAERAGMVIHGVAPLDLRLGPLNGFPNALVAEVQDDRQCLRLLRARLLRTLPARARPLRPWPYLPHVTLGYWGRQAAQPIREALEPYRSADPVTCRVTRIEFTIYYRETGDVTPQAVNKAREEVIAAYTLGPKAPTSKGE